MSYDASNVDWTTSSSIDNTTRIWINGHIYEHDGGGKLRLAPQRDDGLTVEMTEAGYFVLHLKDDDAVAFFRCPDCFETWRRDDTQIWEDE